jgi:citrate lyase subunit beta/citryl-CoA lyase
MNAEIRPRRSALYVPGSNARAINKARQLDADAVIFDLEDAVAPGAKSAARSAVVESIAAGGYGRRELVVRANGPDTPWYAADVAAVAGSDADALLLPKVSSGADVARLADLLDAAGAGARMRLWIMAETPQCVQRIESIARAHERLAVVVMGNEDLAAALRLGSDPARRGLAVAMSQCVLAARSVGLDILDGVYTDLRDAEGFRDVCEQGRALGFDGKTLIHPGQIDIANAVFGVSENEVSEAGEIVAAWDDSAADGPGVIVVGGRMIEQLHVDAARRVLALYAATASARSCNS